MRVQISPTAFTVRYLRLTFCAVTGYRRAHLPATQESERASRFESESRRLEQYGSRVGMETTSALFLVSGQLQMSGKTRIARANISIKAGKEQRTKIQFG